MNGTRQCQWRATIHQRSWDIWWIADHSVNMQDYKSAQGKWTYSNRTDDVCIFNIRRYKGTILSFTTVMTSSKITYHIIFFKTSNLPIFGHIGAEIDLRSTTGMCIAARCPWYIPTENAQLNICTIFLPSTKLFFYFHFYAWFGILLKGMGESLSTARRWASNS